MELNIGISQENREAISAGLSRLLADSYTLYLKTHNYHWNVTGPMFATLHTLFEEHYTELAQAVDEIAERIIDHLQGIEDLKEKMRKVYWLQLDYYERHPGLGKILFMTLPMQTWMSDETFRQKRMINLYLEVLKKGQAEGILNPQVRAGVLLDSILDTVQRAFFIYVSRGQHKSLAGHCPSVGHPVTSDPLPAKRPYRADADRSRQGHGTIRIGLNTTRRSASWQNIPN